MRRRARVSGATSTLAQSVHLDREERMTLRAAAAATTPLPTHGALALAAVDIDGYNAELRDAEGFLGDRASNRAFRAILEDTRDQIRKVGDDPLGDTPTEDLSKKKLDKVLLDGDPVQGISQIPWMSDVEHWGVLTIGTGLGNARFTNRPIESRV
jgi:hypothetical protein